MLSLIRSLIPSLMSLISSSISCYGYHRCHSSMYKNLYIVLLNVCTRMINTHSNIFIDIANINCIDVNIDNDMNTCIHNEIIKYLIYGIIISFINTVIINNDTINTINIIGFIIVLFLSMSLIFK